jgi:hypothetical protein
LKNNLFFIQDPSFFSGSRNKFIFSKKSKIKIILCKEQQHEVQPSTKGKNARKTTRKGPNKADIKDIREEKNFTSMTNAYKEKLGSTTSLSKKRKWFDEK